MSSKRPSERLDLRWDIPTTAEDVAALRRARLAGRATTEEYLRFLGELPPASVESLRSRRGPRGEPFTLPGG